MSWAVQEGSPLLGSLLHCCPWPLPGETKPLLRHARESQDCRDHQRGFRVQGPERLDPNAAAFRGAGSQGRGFPSLPPYVLIQTNKLARVGCISLVDGMISLSI